MSNQVGHGAGDNDPPSSNDDIRAGEFVLGLIGGEEFRTLSSRIRTDAQFAQRVDAWDMRLADWAARFPRSTAPAGLWASIREQLDGFARPPVRRSQSVRVWRWAAAASIGFAAIVSFVALNRPPTVVLVQAPPVPTTEEEVAKPVAVLTRDDGSVGWLASIDVAKGAVLMVPVPTPGSADGLVDELWISRGNNAPRSLGFVSNQKAHTIIVPANLRAELASGAQLSISLEAKPGIPHADRSPRIVAKGTLEGI